MCIVFSTIVGATVAVQQRALSATQRRQSQCVSAWADNYSAVVQARSDASLDRVDSLHQMILDSVQRAPQSTITVDTRRFLEVEETYREAIKTHPFPDPPKLACR